MTDLPTQGDFDDFAAWSGRDVLGPDGDRLGAVELIFLDEATGVPEWVLVRRDDGPAFVPLAGASVEERAIRVEQGARPRRRRAAAGGRRDAQRRRREAALRALRARVLAEASSTVLPEARRAPERAAQVLGAPSRARARRGGPQGRHGPAQPQLGHALPLPPAAAAGAPAPGRVPLRHRGVAAAARRLRAIQFALAGAIAGLIAVLAWRRRALAGEAGQRDERVLEEEQLPHAHVEAREDRRVVGVGAARPRQQQRQRGEVRRPRARPATPPGSAAGPATAIPT